MTAKLGAWSESVSGIRNRAALAIFALVLASCESGLEPPVPLPTDPGVPGSAVDAAIEGPCAEPAVVPASTETDWVPMAPISATGCFALEVEADPESWQIEPDGAFVFRSQADLSAEAAAALLASDPPVTLDVEEVEAGTFRVAPRADLEPATLLKVSLHQRPGGRPLAKWGFQVAAPLRVVSTHPADGAADVPLGTGIELTFSHDGVTGAQERVQITPSVEGRFETHRRSLVFVPTQPLEPGTLYSVTVAAGLSAGDQVMSAPAGFAFETTVADPQASVSRLNPTRRMWQIPLEEGPAITLYSAGQSGAPESVQVTVARFGDKEEFIGSVNELLSVPDFAWRTRENAVVDTAAYPTVQVFEAELRPIGQYGILLLEFPAPLDEGYYVVNLRAGESTSQAWIQVSNLAAYVAVSEPATLVWVRDLTTGAPVTDAEVSVGSTGELLGATGDDGTLLANAPGLVTSETYPWGTRYESRGEIVVTAPGGEVVVPVGGGLPGETAKGFFEMGAPGAEAAYWRYLYTDRALYRPTDAVKFWGVARARAGGEQMPGRVSVAIRGGEFLGYFGTPSVVARTDVAISSTGTYLGELSFAGASVGFYQLEVRDGDTVLSTTGIEIKDFRTPAYGVALEVEPAVAYASEPMTLTAAATFFEGSPAPGVDLVFDPVPGGVASTAPEATTGSDGRAVVDYPRAAAGQVVHGNYEWRFASARPTGAEAGDIGGYAQHLVFAADVALTLSDTADVEAVEAADAIRVISGTVQSVDLGPERDASRPVEDFLGGPVEGAEVDGEVVRITWEREEIGESYDPITKEVIPEYQYNEVRTDMGDISAVTDELGTFTHELGVEPDATYEVTMRTTDDSGRTVTVVHWIYGRTPYQPTDAIVLVDADPDTDRGEVNTGQHFYDMGDDVHVRLERPGGEIAAGSPALFYQGAGGIRVAATASDLSYAFEFQEGHIPNINVIGVVFDGRTFLEAQSPYAATFDKETRRLTVQVEPVEETHRPGQEATLEVAVTDASGDGVEAEVLLSAVDAAVLQVQGGATGADILGALYQHIPSGVLSTYTSHVPAEARLGAEGGGGGDARSDFKDTALFTSVVTDGDGQATVAMPLPDNLTSWAVTAIAVTADLSAGDGGGAVGVSLPAFVDLTVNESYLARDEPFARLRAFGDALSSGDVVRFALESQTLPSADAGVEAEAFRSAWLPLGELATGPHSLTALLDVPREGSDPLADAVERTFEVVESRSSAAEATTTELSQGESLEVPAVASPGRTLTLADAGRGRYVAALEHIALSGGERADQAAARREARLLLAGTFGRDMGPDSFHPSVYQTTEGGVALFPHSDNDLAASVWSALGAPTAFGRAGLVRYLTGIADDPFETAERQLTALAGLAALGEPVLSSLLAVAPRDAELAPSEALAAGLAYASAGDIGRATPFYVDLLAEHGRRLGDGARLEVSVDREEVLQATAAAAALGALLGDPYAPLFFAYVQENRARETVNDLEAVAFLRAWLPRTEPADVTAALTLDGKAETVQLSGGQAVSFTGFEVATVSVQQGAAVATVTRLVPLDVTAANADGPTIERTMRIDRTDGDTDEDGTLEVVEGDRVVVTMDVDLGADPVDGCYTVTDVAPSGLRPVTPVFDPLMYYEDTRPLPYSIDGQRVSFCAWSEGEDRTFWYTARVAGAGTYGADPAVIQSQAAPELIGFGEPSTVTIEPAVR